MQIETDSLWNPYESHEFEIKSLRQQVKEQQELIEILVNAVFSASETFREYVSIHAAKEPPDTHKAEFNQWRCDQMQEALAAYERFKNGS